MARPQEFDTDAALDGAIAVFSEHGYEGSSAQMLVDAMGIGRQSLYAAFGDKWQLYCAVRRYGMGECAAHFEALRSGARAIDGIGAMLRRVVETAATPVSASARPASSAHRGRTLSISMQHWAGHCTWPSSPACATRSVRAMLQPA
jgi:AcrR family transcriptional regulator